MVARSQDANGNVMGRSHTNSILDTRTYQVEFSGGKVTELTTIVIAESMYSQSNVEGNEYLLLDVLVDYQKITRLFPYQTNRSQYRANK